ncbi:ImmA/IrrE family metallo-endopeptidase [Cytobacillus oceanisediminis]|uniref:ImmA/IrrE family metallo-endopeptidase n=1 Tax=Cytobacillus oceanisediminis TaxID=665099 RepID=UPI00254FF5AB|nr:ImmA/IrrE family metallo-endopeptidase [Cytobacillus oceanisediminis]MDK7664356.1 ImmA/IrrE family metallo-endopeptidase [Cytobacillus oceanisediminis]
MFELYKPSELEMKIEKMYKERGILTPSDLDIHQVAKAFNIHIDYTFPEGPQNAIWDEEVSVVFLKSSEPEEKQQEVFFHEFGHTHLHCGDQSSMPFKPFRELQEFQANQFQMYAAIPFFMLKGLDIPKYEYQTVLLIQKTFKVSHKLARKRFEQIKSKILQSQSEQSQNGVMCSSSSNSYPHIEDLFSSEEITEFSFGAKKVKRNIVYYTESEGKTVPVWYAIHLNRGDVKWSNKFKEFPIDAEFDLLPYSEYREISSDAPIFYQDLFLNPLMPNDFCVNLKSVKEMLYQYDVDPYDVRRFVINVKDLEHLLQMKMIIEKIKN